ncbi:DUF3800 domain-containing protein [Porticoccaceae bacterium]|nr:DUF3800 domain-containing protein [Porticoccaceae bacterium]
MARVLLALNYTMESGFIKTLAFIDESGNTDLDTSKRDVSKYFIVCAVIIDDERAESMREEVGSIRKKYHMNGVGPTQLIEV